MSKKVSYQSDIKLGDKYEHIRTGLVGHATAIYFFENACERVCIQYLHDGDIKESTFDAVDLRHFETKKPALSTETGGPRGPSSASAARGRDSMR